MTHIQIIQALQVLIKSKTDHALFTKLSKAHERHHGKPLTMEDIDTSIAELQAMKGE
jgi:hypothetical protein